MALTIEILDYGMNSVAEVTTVDAVLAALR